MQQLHRLVCVALFLTAMPNNSFSQLYWNPVGNSPVVDGKKCRADIGAGSNLTDGNARLYGKCEGAVLDPTVITSPNGNQYISFSTIPGLTALKDRSELATPAMYPFREDHFIGLRLLIPDNVDSTDEFYYILQLWQCSPQVPIFGIRVTRGTSHTINFTKSGDGQLPRSFASMDLKPGIWHSLIVKVNVVPENGNGEIDIWDHEGLVATWRGSFGYLEDNACGDAMSPRQSFRLKFGIYKGNEPSKSFRVLFDEIRMGKSFKDLKPSLTTFTP